MAFVSPHAQGTGAQAGTQAGEEMEAGPAADALDTEPPESLVCPITYSLFRDPIRCLSDGRVYEKEALLGFWRRRPLADFHGGPRLPSASLVPAMEQREAVAAWLADRPHLTPAGWGCRDPGPQSDEEQCERLSFQIDRAAQAREAADRAAMEGGGGPEVMGAAMEVLQGFARSVRLLGRTPGGRRREFLGVYDRCDHLGLVAGRFAYVQRGERDGDRTRMLWYAANGFWHAGWRGNLGQQTGWLIVADAAPAPEHIVGNWQVWDAGKLWQATRVRCMADVEGATDEELMRAAGDRLFLRRDPSPDDDDALAEGESDDETDEEEETAAALASASSSVHLYAAAPEFWVSKPELLSWLGTYDRELLVAGGEPARVNGRFCYAMRRAPDRMLWWANGYWHAGVRSQVGEQTALLIAGDAAAVPERVVCPWMWYERGAWVPSACLVQCAAGPAPPAQGHACLVATQIAGGAALAALGAIVFNHDWFDLQTVVSSMSSLGRAGGLLACMGASVLLANIFGVPAIPGIMRGRD